MSKDLTSLHFVEIWTKDFTRSKKSSELILFKHAYLNRHIIVKSWFGKVSQMLYFLSSYLQVL